VDLQRGDYEEMDQLAIARPHAKAAFRVLHAEDIGVGVARAIRAALSGRPGGVYLDLPAKLFPQTLDAQVGKNSLIKVVDPAPRPGDIGSCVAARLGAINATENATAGSTWPKPPAEWLDAIAERKTKNVAKLGEALAKNPTPMNYHSALNVVRDIVKANPDAILVNEGANALDFTRSIVDMYKPRKRLDVGTWGVMGIGMGFSVAAAVVSGLPVIAIEGDSAFGFSGMEVETICRYNLPVCVVVFNNNGVYRGDEVNTSGGRDPSPLVFVKGARYEKLMEAFGGVGVLATTPAELRNAMEEAIRSRKPTL